MTRAARKLAEGIRFELRHFPREDVDRFVRSVGATLGAYTVWRQYDRKARRAALLRLDEATRAYLAALNAPIIPYFPDRIDVGLKPGTAADTKDVEAYSRAKQSAQEAVRRFHDCVDAALRKSPARARSRPPADAIGLLARIAQKYRDTLREKPTTTPGGAFSAIAVLVLEHAHGVAPKDVARQVRAAIKSL